MKKYYSLYATVRDKILRGEYRAGEKLPSKRVMADMTGFSIVTVTTAYDMLADEGYVCSKERSGYYVCGTEGFLHTGTDKIYELIKYVSDDTDAVGTDFEYSVWFRTVRRVMAEGGEKLFVKAPSEGCAVLRNALADYLLRYRGMYASPNRIVIGSGAEQLYEIAVKLLGRDKIFGVEDPCYEQITEVYDGMGVEVRRLKMGNGGIESSALRSESFDVLHVTPFHSYPSGVTATVAKRHEYLAWAIKTSGYIIEDDFDSEFFMPGQPIESLYALDGGGSVIYINTFSKSLSPSMRMGYMILPEELMELYERRLSRFSCTVPVLEQYVLAEFISGGSFERHLNRVRRRINHRK